MPVPELLQTFLLRWNAHDVEGVVALYAEDAEMRDPSLAAPIRGRDALRRYYASMWERTPDARLACGGAERGEEGIGWAWRFSGEGWSAVGASYFGVVDGAIATDHAVWDSGRVL